MTTATLPIFRKNLHFRRHAAQMTSKKKEINGITWQWKESNFKMSRQRKDPYLLGFSSKIRVIILVAETGFEPRDLRVMSPTSYQAAPLRDIYGAGNRDRTGTGC